MDRAGENLWANSRQDPRIDLSQTHAQENDLITEKKRKWASRNKRPSFVQTKRAKEKK